MSKHIWGVKSRRFGFEYVFFEYGGDAQDFANEQAEKTGEYYEIVRVSYFEQVK